jgi:DNA-binding CsgD family transcriptional regulator
VATAGKRPVPNSARCIIGQSVVDIHPADSPTWETDVYTRRREVGTVNGKTFGRDSELEEIRRVIAETAEGAGGCLVISGPAGIGKSHLMVAMAALAARCEVATAARPAFEADLAAPLVTLASALRACTPPTTAFDWLQDGWDNRYRALERLRASLEDYAAEQPLIIAVDDAQWMDELSALAVRELVPALASSPVRWLFGYRPVDGDPPGQQVMKWLLREQTERIALGVLDEPAVAGLCAAVVDAPVDNTVLALSASCGGNPLQVVQLLNALRRNDQLLVSGGIATVVGSELPSSFIATVQDVLSSLSEGTRQLLRAGSVFGRPFSIASVARLVHRSPAELVPLVEEAMNGQILTDRGGELTFTHDLVQRAVYGTLRASVAALLHQEAATVARAEGRPAIEVAEHLLRTGPTGSREAVTLLRTAAKEVAGAAPATAADLILQALRVLGDHDPLRPALTADAVVLLAGSARLTEAQELGEAALHAGLDAETEATLLLGLAEAHKHAGQNAAAVQHAQRGLRLAGISDVISAKLHAIGAHALFYTDDLAAADRSGGRADELGRASGEFGAAVFGLAARSLVAQAEGRFADALAHARTATDLADREGGAAGHRHPRIWLANAQVVLDHFTAAEETVRRGRQESERLGTRWSEPLWHYYYTGLLFAQGRLDDAVAEADAGVDTAEQLTAYQLAVPLLGALTRLAVVRGELTEAQAHLTRMRKMIGTGITAAPEDVAWTEAVFLEATEGPRSAAQTLTGIYRALPSRPVLIGQDPGAAATLVRVALAAGQREHARLVVAATRNLAARNPDSKAAAAAACHADGLLRQDPVQLRRAAQHFRGTPRRLALASALEDAASVERRTSGGAAGREHYEEARDIAADCGAQRAVQRLQQRLGSSAAPVGTGPPVPASLERLSPAECRVALLVADGMTNIEVAARLNVSRHTVDSHLRKIFQKLDLQRRTQLAARIAGERRAIP